MSLNYFKNLTPKELALVAVGILIGIAAYHFINGFYTGIYLELNK